MLARVMGPKQLTDAVLVDLAIRRKGAVATFDRHMKSLFPPGSAWASHLTVIPS